MSSHETMAEESIKRTAEMPESPSKKQKVDTNDQNGATESESTAALESEFLEKPTGIDPDLHEALTQEVTMSGDHILGEVEQYQDLTEESTPHDAVEADFVLPLPYDIPMELPPRTQLCVNSIELLDNLSTQLLRIMTMNTFQDLLNIAEAHNSNEPEARHYGELISLFSNVKKLYSSDRQFLTVEDVAPGLWKIDSPVPFVLKGKETGIITALRKCNLCSFLLATLGSLEVGFAQLNDLFLDVFCPSSVDYSFNSNSTIASIGRLLKSQAVLYLDLKTQAYISALEQQEKVTQEIQSTLLEEIFPSSLGKYLLSKRGGGQLTPAEQDFIRRCESRREKLLATKEIEELGSTYEWLEFLRELLEYASKNVGFLILGRKGRGVSALGSTVKGEKKAKKQTKKVVVDMEKRATQKRSWVKEEEDVLIEALKEFGPQWSKILELHGPGGKVSEALKNRSQVQLKDKARNWKMFFLKSALPVPEYLQKVTGDLEREERSRLINASKRHMKKLLKSGSPTPSEGSSTTDIAMTAESALQVAPAVSDIRESSKD